MIEKLQNRLKRISVNYHRFGTVNTVKYLFYNGLIKRVKNRFNKIVKGKKYPQNIIFITSLPKSGSTWLSNMCAEIDGFDLFAPANWNTYITKRWDDTRWDLYDELFNEFKSNLAVIRGHTWATDQNLNILKKSDLKYIIGVRDPRDKLISEYYHSRNFPGHWAYEEAMKLPISEFILNKMTNGEFEHETLDWIRSWLKNQDDLHSIIIKYEDLIEQPKNIIKNIFKFLDFEIDDKTSEDIVEKHSFKNVTGRSSGESDDSKFVRKGIAGEWKSLYSAEQKIAFMKIGEDVIKALGYEPTIK